MMTMASLQRLSRRLSARGAAPAAAARSLSATAAAQNHYLTARILSGRGGAGRCPTQPLQLHLSIHDGWRNFSGRGHGHDGSSPSGARGSADGSRASERGGPRGRVELQYARIGGPIDRSVCDLSETEIRNLINARLQCKRARDFHRADRIKDELQRYGVHIDDRSKEWRADGKTPFERMRPPSRRADGHSLQRSSSRDGGRQMPRMKDCQTMEEAILATHSNLDKATNRNLSAFWAVVPRLLPKDAQHRRGQTQQLTSIFNKTAERIGEFGPRDLSTTALAFAKVTNHLDKVSRLGGPYHDCLRGILADRRDVIFQFIASTAVPVLARFDARGLANLANAYALVDHVPKLDDGSTLFHHIAENAIPQLGNFDPQALSTTLNAFVKAGASHPALFARVADHIIGRSSLDDFLPQHLSNTLNAYAKAGVTHPGLFEKMADHIVGLGHLNEYNAQDLSNTAWAFAKAGVSHPRLFERMADHIAENAIPLLGKFNSQNLANTVWAFAKAGVSHPALFENVADHIVGLERLDDFAPQNLSNTVNAFAKAEVSHPQLFEKMGDHIVGLDSLNNFAPQALSNTVHAFAKAGASHPALFEEIADHIVGLDHLHDFDPQALANTVWAFATAEVPHPALFEKVANHIISLDESTVNFTEQSICNLAWAYQTAGVKNGRLADYLLIAAVEKKDEFSERAIKNFLRWTEEDDDN